jgi:hypothetical protein
VVTPQSICRCMLSCTVHYVHDNRLAPWSGHSHCRISVLTREPMAGSKVSIAWLMTIERFIGCPPLKRGYDSVSGLLSDEAEPVAFHFLKSIGAAALLLEANTNIERFSPVITRRHRLPLNSASQAWARPGALLIRQDRVWPSVQVKVVYCFQAPASTPTINHPDPLTTGGLRGHFRGFTHAKPISLGSPRNHMGADFKESG